MGELTKDDKTLIKAIGDADGEKLKKGMIEVFTREVSISTEDALRLRYLRGCLASMLREAGIEV